MRSRIGIRSLDVKMLKRYSIRTFSSLIKPEELDQKIQQRVKLLQESEKRVIRELIEQGLKTSRPTSVGEGLRSLANLGIKGPPDLSQNIDKYLYEDDE
jgi:hypothetical protein